MNNAILCELGGRLPVSLHWREIRFFGEGSPSFYRRAYKPQEYVIGSNMLRIEKLHDPVTKNKKLAK